MPSAKQNIERAKGAADERKTILAEIRSILMVYGKDTILENLIDVIKKRDANA